MKKRNYLLLLSGALALGLASCGNAGGVTGDSLSVSSGDPEAKYQVSETYWNANITQGGFFGVNHNLTMNVSIESADGAIRRANIANANGSLHLVFQGTEETYLELLEDRSYNVYMLENGKWGKENLPATFLATLTPMLQSFIPPWSYADFTYNASTHAYEKASGEATFAGLEGSAENIAFRFEDSKLLSLNFKFAVEGETSDFSLSVANWGSTTITFPKVDEPTSSSSDPSGGGSSASDPGTSGTSDSTPATGATISLSEDEFTMMIYQNHEITATISPEDSGETISWSSSSEIALIEGQNRNGGRTVNIKAEGIGTAVITASLPNGASASCAITIVNDPSIVIPPQSMTISQETLSMNVGEITELSVTVLPKDATYNQIIWTVDRKGVVDVARDDTDMTKATITAVGSGTAVIEAILSNTIEARCTVTVTGGGTPTVEVTSITLSQKSLSMNVNDSAELTATIMPKNATIKEVSWSVEGDAIRIAPDKQNPNKVLIAAVKSGQATVTATAGKITASCSIAVASSVITPTSITLGEQQITHEVGASGMLMARVLPANASGYTIHWDVQGSAITGRADEADQNYFTFTAVEVGEAFVIASIGAELRATCRIIVTPVGGGEGGDPHGVDPTSIRLDRERFACNVGDSGTITASVEPIDASGYTINWMVQGSAIMGSADEANQKVFNYRAVEAGEVTIIASIGARLRAVCTITVNPAQGGQGGEGGTVMPTAIVLNPERLSLRVGQMETVSVSFLPAGATAQVRWQAEGDGIEIIEDEANSNVIMVEALRSGTYMIMAMSGNGLMATCSVEVAE